MTRNKIDRIDKDLICELTTDGRMPVGQIGKKLNVSAPTVRSRLAALCDAAVFKIAGLVNANAVPGIITAIVGIRLDTFQLEEKLEAISALDQVVWACVVTGRYDIMVEVVSTDGMPGLHRFLADKLYKVGGVKSSETFVVMKSKRKWLMLPKGVRGRLKDIELSIDA